MTEERGSITLSAIDQRPAKASRARRPRLVLAMRCAAPLAASEERDLRDVDEVVIGRGDVPQVVGDGRKLVWKLPDPFMSSIHATLRRLGGRWLLEDAGSKNGTLVNGGSVDRTELEDDDLVELGQTFFLYRDTRRPSGCPEGEGPHSALPHVATFSPALAADLGALGRVAASPVNVVLMGESGTGKEVVARAVHAASGRRGTFVGINCGALPAALVEATLFGHKKGAFSGAVDSAVGLVRSGDGGTLLLDEVGDLAAAAQAALLRVLQEREVLPVGEVRPVKVDIRVVSATHHDLDRLAESGRFRADLLARLNGLAVNLPPLRERREDLGLLVATLLRRRASDPEAINFSCAAARALFLYRWPLNVRELENVLDAAVALTGSKRVEVEHLPPAVRRTLDAVTTRRPTSAVDEQERAHLVALLEEHGGNVSAVARALGTTRIQVHRLSRRYRLHLSGFRSPRDRD